MDNGVKAAIYIAPTREKERERKTARRHLPSFQIYKTLSLVRVKADASRNLMILSREFYERTT